MKYSLHKIIRIKDLTKNYFELIIDKGKIPVGFGTQIFLHNPLNFEHKSSYIIASGIQEQWIRLILNKNNEPLIYSLLKNSTLKIDSIVVERFPDLMADTKKEKELIFIVDDDGVALLFNWISSNITIKPKHIYYLSNDPINKNWFIENQYPISFNMPKLILPSDVYYVNGSSELIQQIQITQKDCLPRIKFES